MNKHSSARSAKEIFAVFVLRKSLSIFLNLEIFWVVLNLSTFATWSLVLISWKVSTSGPYFLKGLVSGPYMGGPYKIIMRVGLREGNKILRNLLRRFVVCSPSQIYGGLLRIYELWKQYIKPLFQIHVINLNVVFLKQSTIILYFIKIWNLITWQDWVENEVS